MTNATQEIQAILTWQPVIADDHFDLGFFEDLSSLLAVLGRVDFLVIARILTNRSITTFSSSTSKS